MLLSFVAITSVALSCCASLQHTRQSAQSVPSPSKDPDPKNGIQYVSISGNDANNGLTWSSAKATIQAAINSLSAYGGRVTVGQGDYFLSSGIETVLPNLVLDCVGGRGTGISNGTVRIHVPNGAVGFTFNPSGTSTSVAGPVIKGCSFMAETGAVGGIHILRTNNFTIERVNANGFTGSGHYGLYIDGGADVDSYGAVMNSIFTNSDIGIELRRASGTRLIANSLNGNTKGAPVPGSIGIYQTGSAGGTTMAWGDIVDGFDTLIKMDRCDNDMLMGDRFEGFITAAITLNASSGFCSGVQILGGSISNSILGGGGTAIVVGSSVHKTLIVISGIEGVKTKIANYGAGTYVISN